MSDSAIVLYFIMIAMAYILGVIVGNHIGKTDREKPGDE